MVKKKAIPSFGSIGDFIKVAKPTPFFDNVKKAVAKREREQLLDASYIRKQEDWAKISNQVVGAESSSI